MKRIIIFSLYIIVFVSCSSSWPIKEKQNFVNQCIEINSKENLLSGQSSEDLCECTIKEFSEHITWPEYSKVIKGNLNKDEKAFFNNKVQVVLDKIVEKCEPTTLIN